MRALNECVFVVYEDREIALRLSVALSSAYRVELVSIDSRAVKRATGGSIDVLLIQMGVPDREAVALLDSLRTAAGSPTLPAIVVSTARATATDRKRIGADAWLQRTVSDTALRQTVARLLEPPPDAAAETNVLAEA